MLEDILKTINSNEPAQSIGTKQEKTLHKFIKYYLTDDISKHEITINRNIIDVFLNNHIYEIQTKSFDKLRVKLSKLLDDYPITIIYPICLNKTIYKVNDQGEIISIRKSPKKTHPLNICFELYKISDYLNHPNLTYKIMLFEGNEFVKERISKRKQIRNTPIDFIPTKIINTIDLNNPDDFKNLLEIDLFSSKDFKKYTHLSLKKVGMALLALRKLGVIEIDHKIKNSHIYKKTR